MSRDLPAIQSTYRAQLPTREILERFANEPEIEDILREAAKHAAAQWATAAKIRAGHALITHLYDDAQQRFDEFKHRAYARLHAAGRTEEEQADFEALHYQLMQDYNEHTRALLAAGAEGIALPAYKEVIVHHPRRRGWFW